MKILWLSLLIPLSSFAGSPPACNELGKIVEGYEKDLQKKFITDCGKIDHTSLIKDIPVKDDKFLEGKVCSDLSTIEAQLEKLKIEQAVLSGLDKLKSTIQTSKQETAAKSSASARVAGMTFVSSLNTAASFETLLQTTTQDGKFVIQKLREFPENKRLTQKDLSDRLAEICKEEDKSANNACNPKFFKPGPEAAKEILELIKSSNPTTDQIAKWQGMLAIKRKNPKENDTAYSFSDMQAELAGAFDRLDKNETMTKAHIQAIQKLDDFENARGLSFVEDIASIKDQKKNKIASDKFLLLMGDAELRQQYEVQSKMSVAFENYKTLIPGLDNNQMNDCSNSKLLYTTAKSCYNHLQAALGNMNGDAKANLSRLLPAIKASIDYADSLTAKQEACKVEIKTSGEISEKCLGEMNRDLATVQDKILQLNILKDKIGSENVDLMKYRNFALLKWNTQKCQTVSSPMDFCDPSLPITKDALLTVADSMKVAVVYSPKTESEKEVEALCDDDEKKKNNSATRLCEFFNDTTSNIVKTDNEKKEKHPDGPVVAPDGGNAEAKVRDAWIQGGANILKDVLGHYASTLYAPPAVNPYPYNYAPYNGGTRPMGIADTIMFNARYQGAYGFYMPTAGLQPYTAFGAQSSFSSYKTTSTSSSKYFSF